ncbi:amidohydrolase family protein [Bradyrhizobium sp. AUGA SZCCT0169]|uniref:amidohydrolase family protein n=1 Tax=Bradyrhizobium sp. AUGA SZCCT0169 TaxID=2807663 RepID=UPI002010CBD7|nr:amidohydrolase family protein [Bradyrhizobium sp. AUGA SZCCT0169]
MRIDAHHHLWTLARGDYGWLTPALAPIHRDFSLSDLAPHLAAANIRGTILVQAAPTEAETMFLLDIAAKAQVVRGVVGWTDFDVADGGARIDALAVHSLLVGLRPMVQDMPDDDWLLRPGLARLLAVMARNNLVFDALVLPRHLPRLLSLVDDHPDLQFVLDHCAKPRLATGETADWYRDVALLAERPNIVCKLSGLVTEALPDWQVVDLRKAVDHVVACFGPHRLLWGSDWPVVNLAGGYEKWIAAAETLLAGLSPDEKAAIFGGNAARIYLASRGRNVEVNC